MRDASSRCIPVTIRTGRWGHPRKRWAILENRLSNPPLGRAGSPPEARVRGQGSAAAPWQMPGL